MAPGNLRNLNRRVFGLRWSCSVQILRVRIQVSCNPRSCEFSVHRFIHVTTKTTYFSTTSIYLRESLLLKIARENKEKDESEKVKPLNNADKERVG